jgi:hypothetical protein
MFYEPLKKKRTILLDGDLVETKDPPVYIMGYYNEHEEVFHYLCKNTIYEHPVGAHRRVLVERFTKTQVKAKLLFNRQWGTSETLLKLKPILFVEFRRMIRSNRIITIDSVEQWRELCEKEENDMYRIEFMRKIFTKT